MDAHRGMQGKPCTARAGRGIGLCGRVHGDWAPEGSLESAREGECTRACTRVPKEADAWVFARKPVRRALWGLG